MTRSEGHVRWRRLVDRRDGRLSQARRVEADAHIAGGCGTCEAEAGSVERLIAAIESGPLETPPAAEERRALRLFREAHLEFADGFVVGVLLYDQPSEYAMAVRSAPGETRRLLWRVGEYEVDASLVARSAGTDVLAQIVPGGDDPDAHVAGTVAVRTDRGVRARTRIEPDGRFTFRGLSPGLYTIEGRVDALRFVLPPLNIE